MERRGGGNKATQSLTLEIGLKRKAAIFRYMSLYVSCTENFVKNYSVMKVFGNLKFLFKFITLTSYLRRSVHLQPHKKHQNMFGRTIRQ